MSRTKGSSSERNEERVAEATRALARGLSRSSIVKSMASEYNVTTRTARRWVQAATCSHFDAPLSDIDLGFTVAFAIERLEKLQDDASAAGDRKTEIAACKAAASIAHQRLAARERIEAQGLRIRSAHLGDDLFMSEFMSVPRSADINDPRARSEATSELGAPADIKTSEMPF